MSQSRGSPGTATPRATRYRVVAAEARHVDVRVGDEGGPVAFVAKAPDHPGEGVLERVSSRRRRPVDEIGHRIEAVDREPAVAVDDDLLRGRAVPGDRGRAAGREPSPRRARAPPRQAEQSFRWRRGAVIVLPIMRRFGCGLAAKLT